MKKLMILAVTAALLTVFNSCKKDELKTIPDEGIAKTSKSDVYLENGYLAFKNMDAVDSVINVLAKMSREEKDAWEQKIGLKSARFEFEKLFDEYEKLTNKEEFLKFKAKYTDQLKFNEMDETDCSISYPYEYSYYVPIMNNKGIFKVGLSLFKQSIDGQIIVLDGDMKKLENPQAYSNDKTMIISSKLKSTSGNSNQSLIINNFAEFDPSYHNNPWWINENYGSDRKLLNELKVNKWAYWETTRVYNDPTHLVETRITTGYRAFLRQYSLKKGLFGWNSFYTTYTCNNLTCQINANSIIWITGAQSTSPEVKPEYNWEIYTEERTFNTWWEYSDTDLYPTPNIKMEADLSCRGFEGRLTHVYHNLPFIY
jgi:hypothetical protein